MSATKKDYYKLLEVEPQASETDLKKAYRRLAIKYHPDKNPGDPAAEERFKLIAEAWSVLSNPDTRRRYDQQGFNAADSNGVHISADQVFAAFIANFFAAQSELQSNLPTDVEVDIVHEFKLPLASLYHGKTSRFAVTRQEQCGDCSATGLAPQAVQSQAVASAICTACSGQRLQLQGGRNAFLAWSSLSSCKQCSGSGVQPGHAMCCKRCNGKSFILVEETISVKVHPGSFDGQVLLITGKGNYSPVSKSTGDLLLVIREKPDKLFVRRPNLAPQHLFLDVDISLCDALCGYACEIPHPGGDFIVSTKGIIEPNSLKVVKGKGMPVLGSKEQFGDLILKYHVIFPKSLTKEQLLNLASILPHKSNFKTLNWNLQSFATASLNQTDLDDLAPIANTNQCPIQ